MQDAERYAKDLLGLSEEILMERAGMAVARSVRRFFPESRKIVALAGKGNNGGDALVALRDLLGKEFRLHAVLLVPEDQCGESVRRELRRLAVLGVHFDVMGSPASWHRINHADLLIDGLLGTGLSGELSKDLAEALERINLLDKTVVSIDIPSGVNGETGAVSPLAVNARLTVTLGFPKWGLFLDPGHRYAGKVVVAPIGLPERLSEETGILLSPWEAGKLLPLRKPYFHKGSTGHVGVWGGGSGKRGSAELVSLGALRAGSGLATIFWSEGEGEILPRNPEIMVASGDSPREALFARSDVLAMGPGWDPETIPMPFVRTVLDEYQGPVVADAGIFDVFQKKPDNLKRRNGCPFVLTPHPGEMARLLGKTVPDVLSEPLRVAIETACRTGAVVLLKGWRTVIASPDGRAAVNPTGAPNMATAGVGDVLTGIIASFLGQGRDAFEAALAGVYIHGLAGEVAWKHGVRAGLLAHELASLIPEARQILEGAPCPLSGEDLTLFEPLA
jgi:NAD(P)H-hydrate epimerase